MRFVRIRRFVRDVTGRNEGVLIGHLTDQLDATLDGVAWVRSLASGQVERGRAREQLGHIESVGDDARRALIGELSHTLSTPMDREDLFRVSRSVDDVLDNLRDLAREFDLFEIDAEPLLAEALAGLEDGVGGLREAVNTLLDDPGETARLAAASKKTDVRASYQQAMASLLRGEFEVTAVTLRRRELLRRVDVVGLRLAEAADALADGAVKRSH